MQAKKAKAMSAREKTMEAHLKPRRTMSRFQSVAATNSSDLPVLLTPSLGNVLMLHHQGSQALPAKGQDQSHCYSYSFGFSSGS